MRLRDKVGLVRQMRRLDRVSNVNNGSWCLLTSAKSL
jgi:hypothetical protein